MNTKEIINIARNHALNGDSEMQSSALLCFQEAQRLYNMGEWDFAQGRAAKCVAYAVGVFHEDYKRIARSMEYAGLKVLIPNKL